MADEQPTAATNGPRRIEDGAQGWEATGDRILREELLAILRELGRRRYGETMRSAGGWSILTVPLQWELPTADYPYTQTRINVDEARMRIIANLTMVSADLGPNDVLCLIEWLGAIYASGAWPMERPAWPVEGGGDVR